MQVLFIAQCNKRALQETRRILDHFAQRKGNRTWQTPITQAGLVTLRAVLRKSARRNTAVACHWIKSGGQTELLWIVGNMRQFDASGNIPTQTTQRDILRSQDENTWHSASAFSVLAGLAGLFHDFGKANTLFQEKLMGKGQRNFEAFRHEWVSLKLFQAFVGIDVQEDERWLNALHHISSHDEARLCSGLKQVQDLNPFQSLPPLAQCVAWLIVSHHRLPKQHGIPSNMGKYASHSQLNLQESQYWLKGNFAVEWNASNHLNNDFSQADLERNWSLRQGTPLLSVTWRQKAQQLARRALQHYKNLVTYSTLAQPFTLHIARLSLMLADHYYSGCEPMPQWQDTTYQGVFANTYGRQTKRQQPRPRQQLDEHNLAVAHHAYLFAQSLPKIRHHLPAILRHPEFKKRSTQARFRWQDKAYDVACCLRLPSQKSGFFGVNMASTGCGKTLANARIMYGLADPKMGCRFNVALGLRTLTLQTADALRDKLKLGCDDLAVLIGSAAVEKLHRFAQEAQYEDNGSESQQDFADHFYLKYDGQLDDGPLKQWLKSNAKLHKLVSAPITVSTIDHLISATEATRGGRQIAPMLRLLTSDLILDEPDDFGLDDLPAICRLVNWAGLLGSRVLISSATLPPGFLRALFEAYQHGRMHYNRSQGNDTTVDVSCAWFDEFSTDYAQVSTLEAYKNQHQTYIEKRRAKLDACKMPIRQAKLLACPREQFSTEDAVHVMAQLFHQQLHALHAHHYQQAPQQKKISIGLIRMANIEPLIQVARQMLSFTPQDGYRLHYCIYHSQHPLAMRSHIEQKLDQALQRHDPERILQQPEIAKAVKNGREENQVFIVLATAVAEVGRDHDYDWALVEPSSMRSIIQLAGRVQRHRNKVPEHENIVILSRNLKALQHKKICFNKPGFEQQDDLYKFHDLTDMLVQSDYQPITANPRFIKPATHQKENHFIYKEHAVLADVLFRAQESAALWWRQQETMHLFGEMQARQMFRSAQPTTAYFLDIDADVCQFKVYDPDPYKRVEVGCFKPLGTLTIASGNQAWFDMDYEGVFSALCEHLEDDLSQICFEFGRIDLTDLPHLRMYTYHPLLGIFTGDVS